MSPMSGNNSRHLYYLRPVWEVDLESALHACWQSDWTGLVIVAWTFFPWENYPRETYGYVTSVSVACENQAYNQQGNCWKSRCSEPLKPWHIAIISFVPKLTEIETFCNQTLCDSPRNKQSLHNYYVFHKRNFFHSRGCRLTEGLTDCINSNSLQVGSNPQTMYRATFNSFSSRLAANLLLTVPHIVTHTFQ